MLHQGSLPGGSLHPACGLPVDQLTFLVLAISRRLEENLGMKAPLLLGTWSFALKGIERALDNRQARENGLLRGATVGERN